MKTFFIAALLTISVSAMADVVIPHDITIHVESSDGQPIPNAVLYAGLNSSHWGPYMDNGNPRTVQWGWHMSSEFSKNIVGDKNGTILLPAIRGDYKNPDFNAYVSGVAIAQCGSNVIGWMNPDTGMSVPRDVFAASCEWDQNDGNKDHWDCRIGMTSAEINRMIVREIEMCERK